MAQQFSSREAIFHGKTCQGCLNVTFSHETPPQFWIGPHIGRETMFSVLCSECYLTRSKASRKFWGF